MQTLQFLFPVGTLIIYRCEKQSETSYIHKVEPPPNHLKYMRERISRYIAMSKTEVCEDEDL